MCRREALGFEALGLGILITMVVVTAAHCGDMGATRVLFGKGEDFRSSLRVSLALVPTLIFTLVLAGILRDRFSISEVLFGALLLYVAFTTLLPSLIFRLLSAWGVPSRSGDQASRETLPSSGMAG